jgi:site-specific DNA-methyltransferase (adenine-specific)
VAGEELGILIRTGKLKPGTMLHHTARRRSEWNVSAKVVEDGLQVRGKGRVYNSPSAAARAVTGRPVNGWTFWRLPDGELLDTLRGQ